MTPLPIVPVATPLLSLNAKMGSITMETVLPTQKTQIATLTLLCIMETNLEVKSWLVQNVEKPLADAKTNQFKLI